MIVNKATGVIRMQQKSHGTRKDTWRYLEQDCFKEKHTNCQHEHILHKESFQLSGGQRYYNHLGGSELSKGV